MTFVSWCETLSSELTGLTKHWDGKACILDMRDGGCRNWRQMEWVGWYFQFYCENHLGTAGKMTIPGPRYGKTTIDGLFHIAWDIKAHVTNSGQDAVIVNDWDAVVAAINQYGVMGLILAVGMAEYNDADLTFKQWHDQLKGKISSYEKERVSRDAPSRSRKVSYDLEQIMFVEITGESLKSCKTFNQGRNANGCPRPPKVLMPLDVAGANSPYCLRF